MVWASGFYGEEFFKAGKLLRMSKTAVDGRTEYYMGGKARIPALLPTSGRNTTEVVTNGVTDSRILEKLGSQNTTLSRNKISAEFEKTGISKIYVLARRRLFRQTINP